MQISKWGNSLAVRIPAAVADALDLKAGDEIEIDVVGEKVSLADVALVAYTRLAPEGGFDLSRYPRVTAWIGGVEQAVGIKD